MFLPGDTPTGLSLRQLAAVYRTEGTDPDTNSALRREPSSSSRATHIESTSINSTDSLDDQSSTTQIFPDETTTPPQRLPKVDHNLFTIGLAIGQTLNAPNTITINERMHLYSLIHQFVTPTDRSLAPSRKVELYHFLVQYIRQHLCNVYIEIVSQPANERTGLYLRRWRRFRAAALCNKRLFKYLEEQWIKKERAGAARGFKGDDEWVPMEIDDCHVVLWMGGILEREGHRVANFLVGEIYEDDAEGSGEEGSARNKGKRKGKGKEKAGTERKDSSRTGAGHPWRTDDDLREVRQSLIDLGMLSDEEK